MIFCVRIRTRFEICKYTPFSEGTPEGGVLYLTVEPELSPIMRGLKFLKIIMIPHNFYRQLSRILPASVQ